MSLNLGSLLANSTRQYGSETALIFEEERYTYNELDSAVRKFAAELIDAGVEPGDKVGMMISNGPAFTIAYFGILYAGGVAVTLNTLLSADEVIYQLTNCEAMAFILHADCQESGLAGYERCESCNILYFITDNDEDSIPTNAKGFSETLQRSDHADVCQTMADDTAVLIYTSGTTGHPKGAELTHFNLFYNAQFIAERLFSNWPKEINVVQPGFVGFGGLPLYHIFGQTVIQNAMLMGGGTATYLKRFTTADAVRVIERDKVTMFPGVPTMYFAILHDEACKDADLSSIRFCVSGGAPMPVEVKRQFEEKFNVRIQEAYGLTETSPLATNQLLDETKKIGTVGKPIAGTDLKIVDDQDQEMPRGERGEVIMRGHHIMKGYYKNPEATATALRGGWFHSGDIGYIDEEGDLFIVDRTKDMIIRGGYNVYPREVEEVLYTHPAVMEAAVIGIPHEMYGEEVKAVVSLKPGQEATAEEIIAFCKQHIAAYKYPRHVEIMDSLPKGPTGKLLKRALREA
jgi:long-chain acyl-CoA synthetase